MSSDAYRWLRFAQELTHVRRLIGFELGDAIFQVLYLRLKEFFLVFHVNFNTILEQFLIAQKSRGFSMVFYFR